jgi:hypothetical protein
LKKKSEQPGIAVELPLKAPGAQYEKRIHPHR